MERNWEVVKMLQIPKVSEKNQETETHILALFKM